MRFLYFMCFVLLPVYACSASFDCSLKLNAVERMVCDSQEVSLLDKQLSKLYKKVRSSIGSSDGLVKQQRAWIKNARNRCPDAKCLARIYRARIDELKTLSAKNTIKSQKQNNPKDQAPNFVISKGADKPLCKSYLKLINSLSVDDIKACQLPVLNETGMEPVAFKPLIGEKLKQTDRIIYEQQGGSGSWDDWVTQWPARKKEYESGYRVLSEAFWDLDKDGKLDRIVRRSEPSPKCERLDVGKASSMRRDKRKLWKSKSAREQVQIAQDIGYKYYYYMIVDDKLSFVRGDHFVQYEGEYLSIDHDGIVLQNTTNDWANREWIYIWAIDPVKSIKYRRYREFPAVCKFEYLNN